MVLGASPAAQCLKFKSGTAQQAARTEVIARALYKCFDHTHAAYITRNDVRAFRLAAQAILVGAFAYLTAAGTERLTQQRLEEALDGVIDRVKERAPIWKKEFYEDGAVWIEGPMTVPGGAGDP